MKHREIAAIEVVDLTTKLDNNVIHEQLSVSIKENKITALIGASGAGKTVFFKSILGLIKPENGIIKIFSKDIDFWLEQKTPPFSVCFQSGALFSSLTIEENLTFPLSEVLKISKQLSLKIAVNMLDMVGLSIDVLDKFPSELSGGMKKRVALARSLILEPKLLFLDEPTAGLDPISSRQIDDLVVYLKKNLDITIVVITHNLRSINNIADEVIVIANKKCLVSGSLEKVKSFDDKWIKEYFYGSK